MTLVYIKEDAAARRRAEELGVADDMLTAARVKMAKAIVADVGFVISRRNGFLLPNGRMEIVTVSLLSNFVHGENGWVVHGYTDISWDEVPQVVEKLLEVERVLPQALCQDQALARVAKAGLQLE